MLQLCYNDSGRISKALRQQRCSSPQIGGAYAIQTKNIKEHPWLLHPFFAALFYTAPIWQTTHTPFYIFYIICAENSLNLLQL